MKKLIVNADDFGYSEEINKGIIESHLNGIVTSTSMIVNMPGFKSAVKSAKKHPSLDIGIHLNLTEGKPLLNSLLAVKGKFSGSYLNFILNKYPEEEIEVELEAQITKLKSAGIKISHIDGHQHIHVFPNVFKIIINLAKKHNIKYIRIPDEKRVSVLDKVFSASIYDGQLIKNIALSVLSLNKKRILKENGLKTTDNFYGVLSANQLTFTKMASVLKQVEEGLSELICHPGNENYDNYLNRIREKKILTHENIKQLIKDQNIKLTNFKSL